MTRRLFNPLSSRGIALVLPMPHLYVSSSGLHHRRRWPYVVACRGGEVGRDMPGQAVVPHVVHDREIYGRNEFVRSSRRMSVRFYREAAEGMDGEERKEEGREQEGWRIRVGQREGVVMRAYGSAYCNGYGGAGVVYNWENVESKRKKSNISTNLEMLR